MIFCNTLCAVIRRHPCYDHTFARCIIVTLWQVAGTRLKWNS
jgi:hypothetical protein